MVEFARRNLLKIPDSVAKKLPSKTMSISQLLRHDLPPTTDGVDSMDIDLEFFDATEPTKDIEEILPFLAIPTRTVLDTIEKGLGQAWFDGQKSIRTWINPGIAYPFWGLTYWGEILDACESKNTWLRAEAWVNRRGKTPEEAEQKLTIQGLWSVLGWHGSLAAFGDMQVIRLAALFSKEYLTDIVDALLAILSFRLRLSDNPMSENNLIVETTFTSFLEMLLPIVDGIATGPINASTGAQRYLKKYGVWFQDKDHQHLHLVLHRPPTHWQIVKRCRAIFGKLKCLSSVAEAGIGNDSVLEVGSYGFVLSGFDIVLARGQFFRILISM
ncbi:hypothetical protein B0H13DRAFT_2313655 [Mycena leptocephala]|nr:hypothetical protein B0H13DRAFT_2313655 [Mycena leptocephala]